METWMLISVGIPTYVGVAFVVGKLNYNHFINIYFQEYLESSSYYKKDSIEGHEYALEKAKTKARTRDVDMGSTMGGLFWPVWLPFLIFTKLAKSLGAVKLMQSKPERKIVKMKNAQALTDSRKKEWSLALSSLEESGIDTTELRKMKIE